VSDVTDIPLRATQENQHETDNVSDVSGVLPVAANGSEPDPDDWSFNTEPEDDLDIPECLRRV
jgi:hypothetical protein